MFAAVVFEEKKNSFSALLRPLQVKTEKKDLPSGGCFFVIRAEKRKNKVPFEKIIRAAGKLGNSLILPSGFESEGTEGLTFFESPLLKRKLLFDFAAEGIKGLKLNPCSCSVCVEDREGIYIKEIKRLLPLAAKIQVVCPDRSLYEEEAEELFYEQGCSLIISESFDSFSRNCDAVIAYDGDEMPFLFGLYIFSKSIFSRFSVGLKKEYAELCPEGIDRELFASALYERCRVPYDIFLLDNSCGKDIY